MYLYKRGLLSLYYFFTIRKKVMKKNIDVLVFLITSALLFFSCVTPRIVYDYDKETDFSKYTSFDFYPELQLYMSHFDSTRVVEQFEKAFLIKGIKRESSPEIFVNILSEQFEAPSRNSVGIGVGGTGRNVGVGISGQIPLQSNTLTQVFTVEFIDTSKDLLVWECKYEGRFNVNMASEAKEAYFKEVFEKILSRYPPK